MHFMHAELVWPRFGFIVCYFESNAVTRHCDSEGMFAFAPCSERQGGISGSVFAHAQGRVHPCSDNICKVLREAGWGRGGAQGQRKDTCFSHQSPTPPERVARFAKAI